MNDITEKALIDVGKTITHIREKKNVTIKTLSKRTGIDMGNISKIENGKRNASVLVLSKIADALGCHLTMVHGKLR